ncbi:unnamed protein product [Polarella glacialis]|uniref:NYN domain-containing protein n=1 Tax=Polarella glacialis TaxID=89957 RepID=A0A813F6V6_POLGL|nr:unnamed protein product [Polarella glacialis]
MQRSLSKTGSAEASGKLALKYLAFQTAHGLAHKPTRLFAEKRSKGSSSYKQLAGKTPLPGMRTTINCNISHNSGKVIAMLVDGDTCGPEDWRLAKDALHAYGRVNMTVFAAPEFRNIKKWAMALDKLGANFEGVPRNNVGNKDPNDLALAFAAGDFAGSGAVDGVALLAKDADFNYILRQLVKRGCRAILLVPEGSNAYTRSKLADSGVEFVTYNRRLGMPMMCNLLQADGTSTWDTLEAQDDDVNVDLTGVHSLLMDLGYLHGAKDQWIPAFARMCVASSVGPFAVFPGVCSALDAASLTRDIPFSTWKKDPGNLVYVRPCRSTVAMSKKLVSKFGTEGCARLALAGCAFVTEKMKPWLNVFCEFSAI